MNFNQADLFAGFVEGIHHFHSGLVDRTHGDDDPFSVRITIVNEGSIFPAGKAGGLIEIFLSDFNDVRIMLVLSFAALEIDVVILGSATGNGVRMGIQSTGAEFFDLVPRHEFLPFFGIDEFNILNFMGSAEAVEEMANRS